MLFINEINKNVSNKFVLVGQEGKLWVVAKCQPMLFPSYMFGQDLWSVRSYGCSCSY